jgi:methyltransferase (TIGR00027 family)
MVAAVGRAGHLFNRGPRSVLADWLAWPLVGSAAEALLPQLREAFGELRHPLATWVSARSRICEDWLAASGAEQYVILGAGLDSFAWRQAGGVRVFEVDYPASQTWKRSRLEALDLAAPAHLVWTPVDFETQSLSDGLASAGLGPGPTFVSWLGVLAYLSLEAIEATLRALPSCELAVTYLTPEDLWEGDSRTAGQVMQALARQAGEPFVSLLTPEEVAGVLANCGFAVVEDIGADDVEARFGIPAVGTGNDRITLAKKDT